MAGLYRIPNPAADQLAQAQQREQQAQQVRDGSQSFAQLLGRGFPLIAGGLDNAPASGYQDEQGYLQGLRDKATIASKGHPENLNVRMGHSYSEPEPQIDMSVQDGPFGAPDTGPFGHMQSAIGGMQYPTGMDPTRQDRSNYLRRVDSATRGMGAR